MRPRAIHPFAGAGGLSSGLLCAGFSLVGAVDSDPWAVKSHMHNVGPCDLGDATQWRPRHTADLVAGGPPCQPFSKQGRRRGLTEERQHASLFLDAERKGWLFQHVIRIADECGARAVLLENVPGLLQAEGAAEAIGEALAAAGFAVHRATLDAADYGVPQNRQRVFFVGLRGGLFAAPFAWPAPTHAARSCAQEAAGLLPWVTVREALGLDAATDGADPGPRASHYPLGHALERAGLADRPATTLSAGGGGRLARAGHKGHGDQWAGSVRLSARQCAILQDLRGWEFAGSATDQHRQIGNAVPPTLAAAVAGSVLRALSFRSGWPSLVHVSGGVRS